MDLKEILLEIKRTLFFDKIKIDENVSTEELKVQILDLLSQSMVKHYHGNNIARSKSLSEKYVLDNSTQIKSKFNKFLLSLDTKDKENIQSKERFDPKLAKMINEEKIGITFKAINRNIKISGFTIKKSTNSYIVAYREKELSLSEKRYIIACELVNILIQDSLPKQYQFNINRVISFNNLDSSSIKYIELIKNILMDYYITEISIRKNLEDQSKWHGNDDVVSKLCDIYKMPKQLVMKRITTSRLEEKIKKLEGK